MIFDEPTIGLDILTAKNIISFIHRCRQQNKCVLFSTHIMREAERIADKIVMIHEGKILAKGTWEEFKHQTGLHDLDDIFIKFVDMQKQERELTNEL
jgi:sodium transport system ATP-binding protein